MKLESYNLPPPPSGKKQGEPYSAGVMALEASFQMEDLKRTCLFPFLRHQFLSIQVSITLNGHMKGQNKQNQNATEIKVSVLTCSLFLRGSWEQEHNFEPLDFSKVISYRYLGFCCNFSYAS